jgi:thiamine transporter ThiT
MNTHKVGLAVGAFTGLLHLVWEVLIYLGLAQGLIDWKLSMHSLNSPFTVESFNMGSAIGLIVFAIVGGYIVGSVFATIYNKVNK